MSKNRMQLIGKHLREIRRSKGKNEQQVADAIGVKSNTISAYERGTIEIPISKLEQVCKYLDTDYLQLLTNVEEELSKAMTTNDRIGNELRNIRLLKRMTLVDVAERLGISKNSVSCAELGKTELSVGDIKTYCSVYGCSWIELLGKIYQEEENAN